LSKGKNWIKLDTTVEEAESLLRTNYNVYTNVKTGNYHFACDEYSVPPHLREDIDFIKPTIHFEDYAQVKKKRGNSLRRPIERSRAPVRSSPTSVIEADGRFSPNIQYNLSNCDQYTTPDCLRVLYNFTNGSLAV
jgi:tripeptidyl-peptidase-1